MMKLKRKFALAAALAAALTLAACGGGSNDAVVQAPTAAPTDGVPADATASTAGFMTYMKALVASSGEGLEPFDVAVVTPPTSDTEDPVALE